MLFRLTNFHFQQEMYSATKLMNLEDFHNHLEHSDSIIHSSIKNNLLATNQRPTKTYVSTGMLHVLWTRWHTIKFKAINCGIPYYSSRWNLVIWINQLVSGLKLHKHGMTKISTTETSCMCVNFKIQEDNTSNKVINPCAEK